jgi:hypothetical protein
LGDEEVAVVRGSAFVDVDLACRAPSTGSNVANFVTRELTGVGADSSRCHRQPRAWES